MAARTKSIHRACLGAVLLGALAAGCSDESAEKFVSSARNYIEKKEYASAVIELKSALQKAPQNGEARYLMGEALLKSGDFARAEIELRKARDLNFSSELVYPALARALIGQGEIKKALSELEGRQFSGVSAAEVDSLRGDAYLSLGEPEKAKQSYSAALQGKPDDVHPRLGLARIAAIQADLPKAISIIEDTLARAPKSAAALELKGDLLNYQGKIAEASAAFAQAVAAEPTRLSARLKLFELLIRQKKVDEAQAQVDEFRKLSPGNPLNHYFNAVLALENGQPEKARDEVQQVLKVVPDNIQSLYLAGQAAIRLNAPVQAAEYARRVLQQVPAHLDARRLLVVSELKLGKTKQAAENLKPLLPFAQDNSGISALAGEVLLANGDQRKAAEYYERAVALEERNASLHARLGAVRLAGGDRDGAIKELELAASLNPGGPEGAERSLVLIYLSRNEPEKALAVAQTLVKNRPGDPQGPFLEALVHVARRDFRQARKAFDRSVAIKPDYMPAIRSLAVLDLQDKNPKAARGRYEKILEKEPGNEQALLELAAIQRASGVDASQVNQTLERAVAANPGSANSRLALINARLRSGNFAAALTAAQEARAALPNEPRILEALGAAQQAAGEHAQAVATFERLATMLPDSAAPLKSLAAVHSMVKEYDSAIAALRKAAEIAPDDVGIQQSIANLYVTSGRPEQGLAQARAMRENTKTVTVAYVLEGDIRMSQKQWSEAAAAYRKGLEHASANGIVLRLYTALEKQGKKAEAKALTEDWLKKHPDDALVRLFVADRALQENDVTAAIRGYKSILAEHPNTIAALNNLAVASQRAKDPQAVVYAEQALALAPNSAAVLDTLGWILVERGELARALELLARATDAAPTDPRVRLHFAEALLKNGQRDAARKELEAIVNGQYDAAARDKASALLKSM